MTDGSGIKPDFDHSRVSDLGIASKIMKRGYVLGTGLLILGVRPIFMLVARLMQIVGLSLQNTAILLRHRRALTNADNFFVLKSAGFGHTITGPDLVRRLFPGERNVFAFMNMSGVDSYNSFVPVLFDGEVTVVQFSGGGRIKAPLVGIFWPSTDLFCSFLVQFLANFVRLFGRARLIDVEGDFRNNLPKLDEEKEKAFLSGDPRIFVARSFKLYDEYPAPGLKLPRQRTVSLRARIMEQRERSPLPLTKQCGLYLREKGMPHEIETSSRSGSELKSYLPAVKLLNERGYQVLLTGDRPLPVEIVESFHGGLVDASFLGVDWNLFSVFAATEGDIFCGECGGGNSFSLIVNKPTLLLNFFTFGIAWYRATIMYKTLRDPDGNLVPMERLLNEFAFDKHCDGFELVANTSEQLLAAFTEFLDNPVDFSKGPVPSGLPPEASPAHWMRFFDSRLSPAWIEIF